MMLIGAAAARAGLSVDTVRYYESQGLLTAVRQAANGRREFSEEDVAWLVFLRRMRETGMPIANLQRYVSHRAEGVGGLDGVLAVLRQHEQSMREQRAVLDRCLDLVDNKIKKYEHLRQIGAAPGPPAVDLE